MLRLIHPRKDDPSLTTESSSFRITTLRTQFRATPVFSSAYALPGEGVGAISIPCIFNHLCKGVPRVPPVFNVWSNLRGEGGQYSDSKAQRMERPLFELPTLNSRLSTLDSPHSCRRPLRAVSFLDPGQSPQEGIAR
jgi:hypothetical protein